MRTHSVKIDGQKAALSLSWAAMSRITSEVVDPVLLLTEAARERDALEAGESYTPSVSFGIQQAVEILHIAQEEAGGDMSLEDMGNLCVDHGTFETQALAGEYLANLVGGKSADVKMGGGKTSGKPRARSK